MIGSNADGSAARAAVEWGVRLATLVVGVFATGTLFAAEGGAEAPTDFREKVMIAYGTVFAVLLVYLVLSHRKNAKVREEIELLEERIDELQ